MLISSRRNLCLSSRIIPGPKLRHTHPVVVVRGNKQLHPVGTLLGLRGVPQQHKPSSFSAEKYISLGECAHWSHQPTTSRTYQWAEINRLDVIIKPPNQFRAYIIFRRGEMVGTTDEEIKSNIWADLLLLRGSPNESHWPTYSARPINAGASSSWPMWPDCEQQQLQPPRGKKPNKIINPPIPLSSLISCPKSGLLGAPSGDCCCRPLRRWKWVSIRGHQKRAKLRNNERDRPQTHTIDPIRSRGDYSSGALFGEQIVNDLRG